MIDFNYPQNKDITIKNHVAAKKLCCLLYNLYCSGLIKQEDMCYFLQHKTALRKKIGKSKNYSNAFDEIEAAIKAAGGSDGNRNKPDIPNDIPVRLTNRVFQ